MKTEIKECSTVDCNNKSYAKGICKVCDNRRRRTGTIEKRVKNSSLECSVEQCSRNVKTKGYCAAHYLQSYHGRDLTTEIREKAPNGSGHLDNGYKYFTNHEHPLADKYGRVAEHRMVAYEKFGPGRQRCNWCYGEVIWNAQLQKYWVVVDHLDFDRSNNDPTNLVISCHHCNWKRFDRSCAA